MTKLQKTCSTVEIPKLPARGCREPSGRWRPGNWTHLIKRRSSTIYECPRATGWRDCEEVEGHSTVSGSTTSIGFAFIGPSLVQLMSR